MVFKVQEILDCKLSDNGKRLFHVAWEPSWEEEGNLNEIAPDILSDFLRNHNVKREINNNEYDSEAQALVIDEEKDPNLGESQIFSDESKENISNEDSFVEEDSKSNCEDVSEDSPKSVELIKPRKKGINAIISRLQKNRQDDLAKENSTIADTNIPLLLQKRPLETNPIEDARPSKSPKIEDENKNIIHHLTQVTTVPKKEGVLDGLAPPNVVLSLPAGLSGVTTVHSIAPKYSGATLVTITPQGITRVSNSATIESLKSNVDNIVRLFPENKPKLVEHHYYDPVMLTVDPNKAKFITSTGEVAMKCALCTEVIYDETKYKQHMFMHDQVNLLKQDKPKLLKPGTFECKFCHQIFDDTEKLKQHYSENHEKELVSTQPRDQLYQCALCPESFLDYGKLLAHQTVHQQRKKNEVFILPKKPLNEPTENKVTLLTITSNGIVQSTEVKVADNKPTIIKNDLKDDSSTIDHEAKTSIASSTSMTTLNFQPVNEALLMKSASLSASNPALPEEVKRRMFRCNLCDEMFLTENDRAKHSLIHVNRSSSLDCHICGKQFRHRTNLSTHLIVHSGIKPHQCNICQRRFTQKVNLQRHMHIHDGSRPFSCRMCHKSFTQKANLQRHILSHTEHSKDELLQALNSIPNESEVNNAINESLIEALQIVREDPPKLGASTNSTSAATSVATTTTSPIDKAPSEFRCEICDKVFAQKVNLQKHMMIHSGTKPFQCYVCGKCFRQRPSLQKHYAIHTNGSSSFICQTCNRLFVSRTNLQRHMLVHVQSGQNQCYLCDRKFNCTDNLERHFSEHIEEATPNISLPQKYFEPSIPGQSFRCSTCDITFESPIIFSQHLQCHQRGFPSDATSFNDVIGVTSKYDENQTCPLPCSACGLIFMSLSKLEEHMATHNELTVKKDLTDQNATDEDDLEEEEEEEIEEEEEEEIFDEAENDEIVTDKLSAASSNTQHRVSRCPVCKEIFQSKEEMREHYSVSHMEPVVKSLENDSSTTAETQASSSDNLIKNESVASLVNENEERLIRENAEFIKDNILGGSEEYESKGRYERGNYSCKICNRVLTYKYSLEKHMLLHTGSFPYKCNLCSKRFNHKANLDKHLVVHSGEKPYVCHICQRPFSQKSNLQRHQLTHTQNRDFVCEVCGKRFNHMASLKTHALIHTGAKPFSCYICTKRFNQKGNLKRHIQTHRNGKRNKINSSDEIEFDQPYFSDIKQEYSDEVKNENQFETNENVIIKTENKADSSVRYIRKPKYIDYGEAEDTEPLPTMINDTHSSTEVSTSYEAMIEGGQNEEDIQEEEEEEEETILTVVPSDAIDETKPASKRRSSDVSSSNKKATYHCDSCSKLFISMASLESHKRSAHTEIVCDICGKHFSQKANLLKHKLIHANKKPFECKTCGKAFRQKANLQRHEQIHDKERKTVNCQNCQKTFRCPWSLKQHMKIYACKPNSETKVKSK